MSRIFEALRRSEQEQADQTSAKRPEQNGRLENLLASLKERAADGLPPAEEGARALESVLGDAEHVGICQVHPVEPIVPHSESHVGAEKFRILCHRLRQLRQRRALRSILVSSAIPKEGKTVVALNLAITFARSSSRVLLVDTDLRCSGIPGALGVPALPGLADFLEGRLEAKEIFRKIEPFGLYYASAGTASSNPVELLQGARMREWMAQVTTAFEWIVVDSPPLNPFADAHYMAGLTDAVLMVARSGWTPRQGFQQAVAALEGAHVAGVVLNGSGGPDHGHYYYYSYYASPGARGERTATPAFPSTAPTDSAPPPGKEQGVGA